MHIFPFQKYATYKPSIFYLKSP